MPDHEPFSVEMPGHGMRLEAEQLILGHLLTIVLDVPGRAGHSPRTAVDEEKARWTIATIK